MESIGRWLRQLGTRIRSGLVQFMAGRYGTDKLNTAILVGGVLVCVLQIFVRSTISRQCLTVIAYGLLAWAIFRMLSRNTYKRYLENRRYLSLLQRLKDREHRYFDCPRCHQQIRVPRGKGKISITCPKCKEKFIKKT